MTKQMFSWAVITAISMCGLPMRALALTLDEAGLPTPDNYAETRTLESNADQTYEQSATVVVKDSQAIGAQTAEGYALRMWMERTGDSNDLNGALTASSVYFARGRWLIRDVGRLTNAGDLYVKGQLYLYMSGDTLSNNFFLAPSDYDGDSEQYNDTINYATLRLDKPSTVTLSGKVTPLPMSASERGQVRIGNVSGERTLVLGGTLDLARVAALSGEGPCLDLRNTRLDLSKATINLPEGFRGILHVATGGRVTFADPLKVTLGGAEPAAIYTATADNATGVLMVSDSTMTTHAVAVEGGERSLSALLQGKEVLSGDAVTLTVNGDTTLTLDGGYTLGMLTLKSGESTVLTLKTPTENPTQIVAIDASALDTLAIDLPAPPANLATYPKVLRYLNPAAAYTTTTAYTTELAGDRADALTLTPNGGTLRILSGTYGDVALNTSSTSTNLTIDGGDLTLQDQFGVGTATVTISGGTIRAPRMVTSQSGDNRPNEITQTGGEILLSGTGDGTTTTDSTFMLGHWSNGTSVYNLEGGSLSASEGGLRLGHDSQATLNISGGILTIKGIRGKGYRDCELNLSGGRLSLGEDGFANIANLTTTLSGGELNAFAPAPIQMPLTLTEATTSTLSAAEGQTLAIHSKLTGSGVLAIGSEGQTGTVVLTEADLSDFSGHIHMTSGTLRLRLGEDTGNVTFGSLTGGTVEVLCNETSLTLKIAEGVSTDGTTFTFNGQPVEPKPAEDGSGLILSGEQATEPYTATVPAGTTLFSSLRWTGANGVEAALSDVRNSSQPVELKTAKTAEPATFTLISDTETEFANGLSITAQENRTLSIIGAETLTAGSVAISGNVEVSRSVARFGAVTVENETDTLTLLGSGGNLSEQVVTSVEGAGCFAFVAYEGDWDFSVSTPTAIDLSKVANVRFSGTLEGTPEADFRFNGGNITWGDASQILEFCGTAQYYNGSTITLNPSLSLVGVGGGKNDSWNREGFGFLRSKTVTLKGDLFISEGSTALISQNLDGASVTCEGEVYGPGTFATGGWYDGHSATYTLQEALTEERTLGAVEIRNSNGTRTSQGACTLNADEATLTGAAVTFALGVEEGANTPNISTLNIRGDNTVKSLTAANGGTLNIAEGATLTVTESTTLDLSRLTTLSGTGTLDFANAATVTLGELRAPDTTFQFPTKGQLSLKVTLSEEEQVLRKAVLCKVDPSILERIQLEATAEGGKWQLGIADGQLICTDTTVKTITWSGGDADWGTGFQNFLPGDDVEFPANASVSTNVVTLTKETHVSALTVKTGGAYTLEGNHALSADTVTVESGATFALAMRRQGHTARYVRLVPTARINAGGDYNDGLALAEIQLLSGEDSVAWNGATCSATKAGSMSDKLIDGELTDADLNSKWFWVGAPKTFTDCFITLDAGEGKAFTFDAYRLAMADVNGRNPTEWTLQTSNDGILWETIDFRAYTAATALGWTVDAWIEPCSLISTHALTVSESIRIDGTLASPGAVHGNVTFGEDSTLDLSGGEHLTVFGALTVEGEVKVRLPAEPTPGSPIIRCTDGTDTETALKFRLSDPRFAVTPMEDGYVLIDAPTVANAELPESVASEIARLAAAYGITGEVTLIGRTSKGETSAEATAGMVCCFSGCPFSVEPETSTISVGYDFGISRLTIKPIATEEGTTPHLVIEATVQDLAGAPAAFLSDTKVTPKIEGAEVVETTEVTSWEATTPGRSEDASHRYFRIPLNALQNMGTAAITISASATQSP